MQMSDQIDKWTKGMIQFRKELKQPSKNATNPFFKNNYVNLEAILSSADEAIEKIAEDNGIVYSQDVTSTTDTNIISVTTLISHVSGQYVIYGPFNVPAGSKKDAQAYGSSTTYAKRYALAAALGIASDIDDDGNDASNVKNSQNNFNNRSQIKAKNRQQNNNKIKTINLNEANELEDLVTSTADETNVSREKLMELLLKYLNAEYPNKNISGFKNMSVPCSQLAKKYLETVKQRYVNKTFGNSL